MPKQVIATYRHYLGTKFI